MAVKLHRCSTMWVKIDGHPCWRVQKALDEQGVEYEVVGHPWAPWSREEIERISGQKKYPVIELEDGTIYRAESKDMAERIRSGNLRGQGTQASGSEPTSAQRTESTESTESTGSRESTESAQSTEST
jgi:glutaredoxin